MSDTVTVALIGAIGAILAGVLVELVRTRRRADVAAHEVQPNGGDSLRDVINRIDRRQLVASERASRTEGKVDRLGIQLADHLAAAAEESRTIARILRHLDLPDA
ncbi:hypothetical protein [Jiangella gansuensis]|uniref:hypothetical protein n=1 Tax=Jiangella gansuensis TaxID=281473 RepID=UPI00047DE4E5|nr:hypothetical protein [Jiangella gansuensis]